MGKYFWVFGLIIVVLGFINLGLHFAAKPFTGESVDELNRFHPLKIVMMLVWFAACSIGLYVGYFVSENLTTNLKIVYALVYLLLLVSIGILFAPLSIGFVTLELIFTCVIAVFAVVVQKTVELKTN